MPVLNIRREYIIPHAFLSLPSPSKLTQLKFKRLLNGNIMFYVVKF